MRIDDVLRVVAVRRGKPRTAEFTLRPGERGLSLFALVDLPTVESIIAAVQVAGKRGELAAAVFGADDLRKLGLRLIPTLGGTPDETVNAVHLEARFPRWREWLLRLRGRPIHQEFNERLSARLAEIASILE